MAEREGLLADLAGAILDGAPIDWASAESGADELERPLLDPLRLLATLADVHRVPSLVPKELLHERGMNPNPTKIASPI